MKCGTGSILRCYLVCVFVGSFVDILAQIRQRLAVLVPRFEQLQQLLGSA